MKIFGWILFICAAGFGIWHFVLTPSDRGSQPAEELSHQSPFEQAAERTERQFGPKRAPDLYVDNDPGFHAFEQVSMVLLCLMTGGICMRKVILPTIERLNESANALAALSEDAKSALAALEGVGSVTATGQAEAEAQRNLDRFYEVGPEKVESMLGLFSQISRIPGEQARGALLTKLCEEIRVFRGICDAPQLGAALALATALEQLLRQVSEKPSRLSPSVLRTGAGAILQLEKISKKQCSVTWDRPPRLLAVDDDAVCLRAVSTALKKTFQPPDNAENGVKAVAAAARVPYDLIFMDIEMPDMDGFEACSKIHELPNNKKTPVVFVTSHSDFDSRKKSMDVGGNDLIAKPLLANEITVKALTLIIRAGGPRQQSQDRAANAKRAAETPALSNEKGAPAKDVIHNDVPANAASSDQKINISAPSIPSEKPVRHAESDVAPAQVPLADQLASAFRNEAPEDIRKLRRTVQGLWENGKSVDVRDILGDVYMDVHTLAVDSRQAGLGSIGAVTANLETFFAKLYEKPELATRSALETGALALQLLEELCETTAEVPVAQPTRILVVDDDPVSCRALSNSLQLRFGKPDCAMDGEAAARVASEKPYDVIFMDISMPGINGLTACSIIRKTNLNGATPVVFVTSHSDIESQAKCSLSGGSGFITKPIIPAQIALAASTFTLRGRLERLKQSQPEVSAVV